MRSSARRLVLAAVPLAAFGALLATAGPSAFAAATGTDAPRTQITADPAAAPAPAPTVLPTPSATSSDGFSWG
ncbi:MULTISPECIES: hypothetical protein [unclassified Streptomyces]|uniref:hypothetical protein n=1 Tax=unclassified Streptomyces TaxID=2593676 RepID=UPI00344E3311